MPQPTCLNGFVSDLSDLDVDDLIETITGLIAKDDCPSALERIGVAEAGGVSDVRIRRLKGLAFRRCGSLSEALEVFTELYEGGDRDPETLGVWASTFMERYDKTANREDLERSRDLYAEAFEITPDSYYVGINAAGKSLLLGDSAAAAAYLERVEAIVGNQPVPGDYWRSATVAELQLMLKNYGRAAELYRRAVEIGGRDDHGSQITTWRQAERLMNALEAGPADRMKVQEVFRHLRDGPPRSAVSTPAYRKLRVFAFDPSASRSIETVGINEVTLSVPWEHDIAGQSTLQPGPVGEYLEVVDFDPSSGCFYEPVDLDDPRLLATDGYPPSEGEPGFHQQMVYGVAMRVIDGFERALGRRVLWASRLERNQDGTVLREHYVPTLRIYPHALREANAYYSPDRKALLFGYFPADTDDPSVLRNGVVFTSLSHDVIAHEMSHALLDGMHPHFAESTNPDVLAFHEAFADIVALFQHFSHAEVIEQEIARTRGELATGGLLAQLAQEFGRAIGSYGALRDAIGHIDPETHEWRPTVPDPEAFRTTTEPHERGAILVAAVFRAFLTVYNQRIDDLIRIATQGSGVLAPGALHPDLVRRLANEAAKTAQQLLQICLRALDYCPPVDITFGDYLRAVITADVDAVPDDRRRYRLAIIEAFRQHGIYPGDVRNLAEESLVWRPPRGGEIHLTQMFEGVGDGSRLEPEWASTADRRTLWKKTRDNSRVVHAWLDEFCSTKDAREIGLSISAETPKSVFNTDGKPTVEVHSVRLARRVGERGETTTDIVIEILQRRRGYFDPDVQFQVDKYGPRSKNDEDFIFRGGCTLLVDPADGRVRYAVNKHILSDYRLDLQRRFLAGEPTTMRSTYFGSPGVDDRSREPFALLHRAPESRVQSR